MKKSLLALAVLGAIAGAAHAQSAVTIYGQMDVGLAKTTGSTTGTSAGDNNKLGFKGTEDLGNGLSALFQAEMRFDPNTGKTEGGGTRPLFQGSTVVGLSGGFGTLRLGRALTAKQAAAGSFDPWGATRNRGAQDPQVMDAGYISSPLEPENTAENRFSNGVFYSTPKMAGFQVNLSAQTKQKQTTAAPETNPFSLAGTYDQGPFGAMVAYERNAVNANIWQLGGSYNIKPATIYATYAKTKAGEQLAAAATDPTAVVAAKYLGADAKAWTLGSNISVATGNVLLGYGQSKLDVAGTKTAKFSAGYEHKLSKRTFLYTDYVHLKTDGSDAQNTFDVGVHHNF